MTRKPMRATARFPVCLIREQAGPNRQCVCEAGMTKLIFGLFLLEQQQSGNALSTGLG